ncbi:MAG: CvpA family protein [Rhodobacter sp.]|uniref:CvpA family protein n=1 Tax=Pararhodobacter sp. TaxID=2127056 RepID=UPI001D7187CB|nr:CvpA family protein [Pararhodobacter sp.]MCB1344361.1 CvpA family protein [Paracoccaceae bacterium]MCC0074648.1 CvpA family protein [Rhodobacter sp.]HPD92929.1 CvpA family protein [Pararhodobacter sp.]
MESFTLVDAAVALVIVVSAILAYSRGLVREILAIAGWIVAAIVAFVLAPTFEPLVREIPYLGQVLGDSCELTIIASFAAVFAVMLMVVALFTPLFSSLIRNSALGGIDQGLGFFFGVLRGIVLVAVALMVFQRAVPAGTVPMVDNSRSIGLFQRIEAGISDNVPSDAPNWIVQRYEDLTRSCAAPAN